MRSLLTIIFIIVAQVAVCQPGYQYRIQLADKNNNPYSLEHPLDFLSGRSIDRRRREGVKLNERDLPINPEYIGKIAGFPSVKIVSKSKWFNDLVIQLPDTSVLNKIRQFSFIESLEPIPGDPNKQIHKKNKSLQVSFSSDAGPTIESAYGRAFHQTHMLRADYLHALGYRGKGMRIGVIDAGYSGALETPCFANLFAENRVIDTYDFVDDNTDVYANALHGTVVLSVMAADQPGAMIGYAPDAEYILLRSEDGSDEYLLEEYFWVEAAEFADSAGVDIINTSLGYTTFTDSLQDHSHTDLDGKTTRITLGTDMAWSRGILLVNSAGNSGNQSWMKISAPADAFHVITAGGVDSTEIIANFSSIGPTADGRIKPDLLSMGAGVYIMRPNGEVGKSNGTSFSSPILAAAAASLWSANPQMNREQIEGALKLSSDRYMNPDTIYGYGIPNLILANEILRGDIDQKLARSTVTRLFPNPFTNYLILLINVRKEQLISFDFYDLSGKELMRFKKTVSGGEPTYLYLDEELASLPSGMCILKMNSPEIRTEIRLVKK